MTLLEFEQLEMTEQLEHVVENGTPISQIKSLRRGHLLYSLYNFYVELDMEYKKGKTDVTEIHCYRMSLRLNKYLKQIDLSDIGIDKAA